MRKINLFSYSNTFKGAKRKILRPGIGFKSIILVLTHTRPTKPFVEIDSESILSEHFGARAKTVYLTEPDLAPVRYNNAVGGELHLSTLDIEKISQIFHLKVEEIWSASINLNIQHHNSTFFMKYADLSKFMPATQADIIAKGGQLFQSQDPQTGTKAPATVETIWSKVQANITANKEADNAKFAVFLPHFTLAEAKATLELIPGLHLETGLAALNLENAAEVLPHLQAALNKNPNTDDAAGEAIMAVAEKLGIELNLDAYVEVDPADVVAAITADPEAGVAEPEPAAEPETEAAPAVDAADETTTKINEPDASTDDTVAPVKEEEEKQPASDTLPATIPTGGIVMSAKVQTAVVHTLEGLSEAAAGIAKATKSLTAIFQQEEAVDATTEVETDAEVIA